MTELTPAEQLDYDYAKARHAAASGVGSDRTKLINLVNRGCEAFYREVFGDEFWDSLADHHKEALGWHWDARVALCKGERPPNDWFAYFPIWARGNNKTTLAEIIVVVDAMISLAFNVPGFCLYIGREKEKIKENISNIEGWLYLPKVKEYAPSLSQAQQTKDTNEQGRWTAFLLQTNANYVIKGVTVESANAGSKFKKTRVTLFVPDDIDDRHDSPVLSESRYKLLTSEILPMKQANTLTFFAQNLISRYSVMYRLQKGQSRALANRKPTEPIPAVIGLETEEKVVDGRVRDVVIAGTPTWKVWDRQRIQDEIDTMTLPVFLTECQHLVEQSKEGRFHKTYADSVHAISHSQFAAIYGRETAWKDWFKVPFSDWSRTKTKFHANVAGYLAVSSANTKHPGFTFCVPFSFRADTQPEDVAERMLSALTPYAYGAEGDQVTWKQLIDDAWKRLNAETHYESVSEKIAYRTQYYKNLVAAYARKVLSAYRVSVGANSHSEDKVRDMLNSGFGFNFMASNPGKTDALEDIDAAMKFDMNEAHIFKPDQMGYTRWYVLCKNDYSQEPELINGIFVYPPVPYPDVMDPKDLHDDDLFRYQMVERRFRNPELTKAGEIVDEPEKTNDDYGQALQMVYFKKLLQNIRLTETEQIMASMPEEVKPRPDMTVQERMGMALYMERVTEQIKQKRSSPESDLDSWRSKV